MRRSEIEARVLALIERVHTGKQREDSFADLKAEWPTDHAKSARQIAGLCNAARGEPALWLIGVDEKRGVLGAPAHELSAWWGCVRSAFAGQVPMLQDVAITLTGGAVIVALAFETDASPFVVRNPLAGRPGGGAIDREVPWREGTATRSATREELLQLLRPISHLPEVEVIAAVLTTHSATAEKAARWNLNTALYIVPRDDRRLVIPIHRSSVTWSVGSLTRSRSNPMIVSTGVASQGPYVHCTLTEAIITGPCTLSAQADRPLDELPDASLDADVLLRLNVAGAGRDMTVAIALSPEPPREGEVSRWSIIWPDRPRPL